MAKKTDINKQHYNKPTMSPKSLLDRLKERGLIISNETNALNALTFIGYFRLRGYCYPFYKTVKEIKPTLVAPKTFIEGTTFDDIVELYEFDRKVRLLIIEEIQKIEVGLRTCLSEHMSNNYGPHWFMNLAVLSPTFKYDGFYARIKDAKELFISHYYDNYQSPSLPPSWMIAEVLTFGTWSRLYTDLFLSDQKAVAKKFSVKSPDVMGSWFHSLSHLRNLCAHHNRIWNRNFQVFIPKDTHLLKEHMAKKNTLYSRLCVVKYLSDQVSIANGLTERLRTLMDNAPKVVTIEQMGFIEDWYNKDLWILR
ncbi:Abi family protein [Aliivibrio wodanis]|uniref:Abi family protein n=1 Tax=Aliivibrio wodanis TaxID=80852 RepID=UPI00406C30AB